MAEQSTAIQRAREATPLRITPIDDIFSRVNDVYDAIARQAFELFDGRGRQEGHDFDDWIRAESELFHPAHLEVSETDDAFGVRAEVPGFKADEIQVSLESHRLTIMGQRQSSGAKEKGKNVYTDRCSDQIFRAIDLPADVDSSKATATLKDGILDLVLPKAAPARKIPVVQKSA